MRSTSDGVAMVGRSLVLSFVSALLLLASAAAASSLDPVELPIGESTAGGHPCGLSSDGATLVIRDAAGTGWLRWTATDGLEPISGAVTLKTRDIHVSDDGRYVTMWLWDITASSIQQLDTETGITTQISEPRYIANQPAVSPSGDRVTWSGVDRGQVGPQLFAGVRQWNRSTGATTTLLDMTDADQRNQGSFISAPSPNGRFLAISSGPPGQPTAFRIMDTTTGAVVPAQRPIGRLFASLLGLSDDGLRVLWLDGPAEGSAGERWLITDRDATTQAAIEINHSMSPAGEFIGMQGQYHFAPDGTEVLAIGAREDRAQPRGEGVAYRWTIGGELEVVNTSNVTSGIQDSFAGQRSSSWCDVSADLQYVVVADPINSPAIVSIADLDQAAPRQVASEDVTGPQLNDQITRLYAAFFDRPPDDEGLAFWVKRRAAGTSLNAVADAFVVSDEFISRYGALDNTAFVHQVYSNVVDRGADADGLAFWVSALESGTTRGSVMIGFSESPENIARTATTTPVFDVRAASISRLYRAFFNRPGEASGLTFWFDRVSTGQATLGQIASDFVRSTEFTSAYGDLDDAGFVDLVYLNVLERSPDDGGRTYWLGQLADGRTRGDMMVGFSESPEYIEQTNTLPPNR